jgi:hypothetical protein
VFKKTKRLLWPHKTRAFVRDKGQENDPFDQREEKKTISFKRRAKALFQLQLGTWKNVQGQ